MLVDFKNATLKIGAVNFYPFFVFHQHSHSNSNYSGICFRILKILASYLNFNFNISPIGPGGLFQNGSWTSGIVSEVNKSNFDIGLDAVTQNYDRFSAVDFTFPFMSDKASILSPAPVKQDKTLAIIEVFSPEVWLLIVASVLSFCPVMKAVEKIRLLINPNLPKSERGTLVSYMWNVICLTLLKGFQSPTGSVPRIIVLFWSFMVFTIFTMYSGVLLALLSFPSYSQPINSLNDLIARKDMKWGAFFSSANRKFIEDNLNHPFPEVKKGFDEWPELMPRSIDEAAKFLRAGQYSLIADEIIFSTIRLKEIESTDKCPYFVSSEYQYVQYYSIIVPKNSPYLSSIDIVIQRLIEGGLINYWLQEIFFDAVQGASLDLCRTPTSTDFELSHQLRLTDIQGAFIVLFFGTGLSLLTFIGEWLVKRRRRNNVTIKRRVLIKNPDQLKRKIFLH